MSCVSSRKSQKNLSLIQSGIRVFQIDDYWFVVFLLAQRTQRECKLLMSTVYWRASVVTVQKCSVWRLNGRESGKCKSPGSQLYSSAQTYCGGVRNGNVVHLKLVHLKLCAVWLYYWLYLVEMSWTSLNSGWVTLRVNSVSEAWQW